jgi:hypothetical protein
MPEASIRSGGDATDGTGAIVSTVSAECVDIVRSDIIDGRVFIITDTDVIAATRGYLETISTNKGPIAF